MSSRNLLTKLLDYILEQDKEVDPRGFKLSGHRGFLKAKPDLQGLPGVDFDIKVEGDHTWMRVARLEAARPPACSDERFRGLIIISDDPNGSVPRIDEAAFKHRLALVLQQRTPDKRADYEAQARVALTRGLSEYTPIWTAWAEGEKPRRKDASKIALPRPTGMRYCLPHEMSLAIKLPGAHGPVRESAPARWRPHACRISEASD